MHVLTILATEKNNNLPVCGCEDGWLWFLFSKSYEPFWYPFCLTDEITSSVTACCHPSTKPPLLLPITGAFVHNLVIDVSQSQYVSSISYILTITSSNFLYYIIHDLLFVLLPSINPKPEQSLTEMVLKVHTKVWLYSLYCSIRCQQLQPMKMKFGSGHQQGTVASSVWQMSIPRQVLEISVSLPYFHEWEEQPLYMSTSYSGNNVLFIFYSFHLHLIKNSNIPKK
jgi:hypothetical protein